MKHKLRISKIRLLLFLFIFICLSFQKVETIKGKVIKVTDGDTVTLLTDAKKQVKIRLYGIDCPEKKQDFGTKARNFTNDLCYGKTVQVEIKGKDKYRRILGIVKINGTNVNEELLKNGLAWKYKYTKSLRYSQLEEEARKNKLNLWGMKNPVAPWDFRKKK